MLQDTVISEIQKSIDVKKLLVKDKILIKKIYDLAGICIQCLNSSGKVIFCGNGGSFADAQHLSAEFTSRFLFDRPGLASIALGTNSSAMSAIGNDYGFEDVFSREIEAVANKNDVLIAITTSGNSSNVIRAAKIAKSNNMQVIVFTGCSNGQMGNDFNTINVPSNITARIQECHILIGHIVCGMVEESIFGNLKLR